MAGTVDGLPVYGDPAAAVVTAVCGIALLVFLFLGLKAKGMQGGALYSVPSRVRAVLLLGSAVTLLFSAILQLKTVMDVMERGGSLFSCVLEVVLVILSIPSMISFTFLAKDTNEGTGRSHDSLTVLFPVLHSWFWLIDLYRRHSGNPVLWDYLFLLMGAVFFLLATFGRSGFSFGDGKPDTPPF